MHIGYSRTSPDKKHNAAQTRALKAAGCTRLFREKPTTGRWDRPQLQKLLEQLQAGDEVVVCQLDSLSRSLKDLLLILERIDARGATFQSLAEKINTGTSAGRMMMRMVVAVAEFERAGLKERARQGSAQAREQGRVGGRRPKLSNTQRQELMQLVESEQMSATEAARRFKLHPSTVGRILAKHRSESLLDAQTPANKTGAKKAASKAVPGVVPKAKAAASKSAPSAQKQPKPATGKPPATNKKAVSKKAVIKKTGAKKADGKKASAKKPRKPPVEITLDVAGLERPAGFTDNPFAVRYSTLVESYYPKGYLKEGQSMGLDYVEHNAFASAKKARQMIEEFKARHTDSRELKTVYVPPNKNILKLTAVYEDPQPDHQLVLFAANR